MLSVIGLTLFGLMALLQNQFGFDRSGFRAFVLSGVSRREILLGKNLGVAPIFLGIGLFVLMVMQYRLPMRALSSPGLHPAARVDRSALARGRQPVVDTGALGDRGRFAEAGESEGPQDSVERPVYRLHASRHRVRDIHPADTGARRAASTLGRPGFDLPRCVGC